MPSQFTTVIISDSRGRGLEDYLGSHPLPEDQQFAVLVKPGKSLSQLCPIIINTIDSYDNNQVYCIVYAGICGLTDRTTDKSISKRASVLRYQDTYRGDKIECNTDSAKFLKNRYGDRINFCTIIPADLISYFCRHNPGHPVPEYLNTEQKALEEDVLAINKALLDLNSSIITNINLCSRAQVKSKKKRQRSGQKVVYRRVIKFSYKELIDGVHFTQKLRDIIFGLIIHTALRDTTTILRSRDNPPPSD